MSVSRRAPEDWGCATLDSLVQEGYPICYGVLKPGEEDPYGVPLVRIVDIEHDEVDLRNLFRISKRLDEEFARSRLRGGELLISIQGTIGRVAIAPRELAHANISRTIARVAVSSEADVRFVRYWLISDMGQAVLRDSVLGTTRDSLNIGALRLIQLSLPPLPKQHRIAEILDAADEAIRQTERLIAKLKAVKAGLLHDLLTRGLDEHAHLRDPQAHPEQFKDSPLGRIPQEWTIRPLELCVCANITYGIVQAGPHIKDGIPYIRTGDMSGDRLTVDGLLRTSKQIAESYKRSEVHTGEVVCAIRATVGKVLEVPPELDGANLTQGTARIAPLPSINSHFLLWMLRSDAVQRQFDMAVKGTTFREITLEALRKLEVPLPVDRKEQDRIATILDTHDTRIRAEETALEKLRQVKRGLMDDLLTGRVRVTP